MSIPNVSGSVLAGGQSQRMGRDKLQLDIGGTTLLSHVVQQMREQFSEVLVAARAGTEVPLEGVRIVHDDRPDEGPVMGVTCAMRQITHDLAFVIACDIPEMDFGVVQRMIALADGADAVVPRLAGKRWEPIFAVYNRSILPHFEAALAGGRRKILDVVLGARVVPLDLPEAPWLWNLNRPEDWEAWVRWRGGGDTP